MMAIVAASPEMEAPAGTSPFAGVLIVAGVVLIIYAIRMILKHPK